MGTARAARLRRLTAALEETIARLETRADGGTKPTVRRLRVVQGEILAALALLEGEFPRAG